MVIVIIHNAFYCKIIKEESFSPQILEKVEFFEFLII